MVQNPSSNPASGRETYTQTIVQTVHAETTPTYPNFPLVPHFIFSYPHLSFCVPAVWRLTQVWSLIIVLLSVRKQDALLVGICPALVCQCRVWIDRLKAGSHAGLLFLELGEQVQPHWPLRELKVHKEMSRWGGQEKGKGEGVGCTGKYQALSGGVETDL